MTTPAVGMQVYNFRSYLSGFGTGRIAAQRIMAALIVVKLLKAEKLALQAASSPKGDEVEVLSPDSADEPFQKRVRDW